MKLKINKLYYNNLNKINNNNRLFLINNIRYNLNLQKKIIMFLMMNLIKYNQIKFMIRIIENKLEFMIYQNNLIQFNKVKMLLQINDL